MVKYALTLLCATASAHYAFPTTTFNGVTSQNWQYIRQTEHGGLTDNTNGPADMNGVQGACFQGSVKGAPEVLTVNAGSQISFNANNNMGHVGPLMWFMARVPDGSDVKTWDPAGKQVWFKISQSGMKAGSTWPDFTSGGTVQTTTIPKAVPNGNYLLRFEQLALHVANQPQSYIACAQVKITNGGSGNPSPLVTFPGQYKSTDQSVYGNIYNYGGAYSYPALSVWTSTIVAKFAA
ncbi:cellulose-growth-specific protein [Elsinoe ampelina]|uniref:lytic cellulose monooxygenase (C4-dehydrogenating) n=1 Tax=Elsinoe ampelina TaxID=302913 RepID=A0A6A6G0U3_9PEZI|nr:cellulose-growth-specific protein [Elsinoe ampelina]